MRRVTHGQTRDARAAAIPHRAIRELRRVVRGRHKRAAAPYLDEAVVASRRHKHIVATEVTQMRADGGEKQGVPKSN